MANVNLSAHAYWSPDPTLRSYLNYGAAISEVSLIQIEITTLNENFGRLELRFFSVVTFDLEIGLMNIVGGS
jgi:hypothetical protein